MTGLPWRRGAARCRWRSRPPIPDRRADIGQKIVITTATRDLQRPKGGVRLDLEDEARVIFEITAKGRGEEEVLRPQALRAHRRDASGIAIESLAVGFAAGHGFELTQRRRRIAFDGEIGVDGMDRLGRQRMRRSIGRLVGEPRRDVFGRAAGNRCQPAALEFTFNPALCFLGVLVHHLIDMGRDAGAAQLFARRETGERLAECLRPPELMDETAPPARRHVEPVEQRVEKMQIAKLDAEALEPGRLDRGDGERQNLGLGGFRIGRRQPFNAGLAEFAGRAAALREAEGRPAIAVTRLAVGPRRMHEMITAGGHGEIRAQAHLGPFRIGEDIGIGADILARAFEEDIGRLQDVGRDMIEARPFEDGHDALILGGERDALGRGPTGHRRLSWHEARSFPSPRASGEREGPNARALGG
jgi:hypothetical protein